MDHFNNTKAILHYKHIKLAINNFHKLVIVIQNYKDYYP